MFHEAENSDSSRGAAFRSDLRKERSRDYLRQLTVALSAKAHSMQVIN